MSLVTDALLSAYASAADVHGEVITYHCGEQSIEFIANPGHSEAEVYDQATGLMTTVELQDWLVRSQDLKLGETAFLPERGHRIDVTANGLTRSFVVNHPDANRPPYRRSDPHGVILRIHTRLVEQTPTE